MFSPFSFRTGFYDKGHGSSMDWLFGSYPIGKTTEESKTADGDFQTSISKEKDGTVGDPGTGSKENYAELNQIQDKGIHIDVSEAVQATSEKSLTLPVDSLNLRKPQEGKMTECSSESNRCGAVKIGSGTGVEKRKKQTRRVKKKVAYMVGTENDVSAQGREEAVQAISEKSLSLPGDSLNLRKPQDGKMTEGSSESNQCEAVKIGSGTGVEKRKKQTRRVKKKVAHMVGTENDVAAQGREEEIVADDGLAKSEKGNISEEEGVEKRKKLPRRACTKTKWIENVDK